MDFLQCKSFRWRTTSGWWNNVAGRRRAGGQRDPIAGRQRMAPRFSPACTAAVEAPACDKALVGVGVGPNEELALQAGLEC